MYQERNDFEETRGALYGEGLDILLRKWDAKRGVERDRPYGLSIANMEILLGEIAFSRFKASEYFFDQGSLEKQIETFFAERKLLQPNQELLPEQVLNSIEAHIGLLVQRAARVYSFSHLTFQEYLTAMRVAKKRTLVAEIGPHVGDLRWREVWLLLVTMLDGDDILRELKHLVDMLAKNEPDIQKCLTWYASKASAYKTRNFKRATLRTMFLGLDPSLIRISHFDLITRRSSDSAHIVTPDHAFDNSLNRDLTRTLELPHTLEPGLSLTNDLLLHYKLAVAISLARAIDKIFAIQRDRNYFGGYLNDEVGSFARALVRVLLQAAEIADVAKPALARQLRTLGVEAPPPRLSLRWQGRWSTWHLRLRELMIIHNISHGCDLTQEQEFILGAYQRANLLLVECMNTAYGLTNKTRESIEDSILLPWCPESVSKPWTAPRK